MKQNRGIPIPMEQYRQLVFDVGAHLMDGSWDKERAANCLFELADRPVRDEPETETARMAPTGPACMRCRSCVPDSQTWQVTCEKGLVCFDLEAEQVDCEAFDSRYIQYPLTIQGIETRDAEDYLSKSTQLVRVRPADGKKTYIGFYLGELGLTPSVSFNRTNGILKVSQIPNPAIYVPELGRIVFGYESWWSPIRSEKELKDITDADIEAQPYVQYFRAVLKCQSAEE